MPEPLAHAAPPTRQLQCMEVWGGNQAVDNGVVMPGLDAWVFARPHKGDAAGGDLHYLSSCATGRITRLMVADVSGHGQSASATAAGLRTLMRRYINHLDQRRAVQALNRAFAEEEASGRFATALLGTYWGPTGALTLCNAGHPRPMWYQARKGRWRALAAEAGSAGEDPVDVPLGVMDSTTYTQLEVRLARGDLVLLYTDSLVEARLPSGRLLGEAGLLEVLNGLGVGGEGGPARLIAGVLAEFERRGAVMDDDITALLLQPNGVTPPLTIRERLTAMVHVVRAALTRADLPEVSVRTAGGLVADRFNRGGG